MKKRLLPLLLVVVMIFLITACGQTTDNNLENQNTEQDTSDVLMTQYPITVTDQANREVTIENEPQKIVSGYYISTSLLIGLGLEDKIVGIENSAEKRAIYHFSATQLLSLPNLGTVKEFDLEGCLALEPDLVILPLKLKNMAEPLENLGIDTIFVNPESPELLEEMITLVGTSTNTTETANALKKFITTQETMLTNTLADVTNPTVYLAGNSNLLSTAGSAMYQSNMITLAGGNNVAKAIEDTYWAEIDYEQLLTWNPDYIILAADATYTIEDVLTNPNLSECSAVKKKQVYKIPNTAESWDSPVPSAVLGSVWLATILHEDLISTDQASEIFDEYYETFYNFTYSEK